ASVSEGPSCCCGRQRRRDRTASSSTLGIERRPQERTACASISPPAKSAHGPTRSTPRDGNSLDKAARDTAPPTRAATLRKPKGFRPHSETSRQGFPTGER